jgi:AbrB family looped-hinge helix DNA binding protein
MFATLTSKGQLTLPKEIRDRLNLDAGAILDFQIQADNTITARQVQPDARRIRGLLKSPHAAPLTVEQMDEAVSIICATSTRPARRAASRLADDRHRHQHPAAPLAQR